MFPEHVERSFLDPEYSFAEYFQLGEETFAQLRTGFRPSLPLALGLVSLSGYAQSPSRIRHSLPLALGLVSLSR